MTEMGDVANRFRLHGTGSSAPRSHLLELRGEGQHQIVGRHRQGLGERQAGALRERLQIVQVAHAPFGVFRPQTGVEFGVARRRVLAGAHERAIEEQPAVGGEIAAGAGDEVLRHLPW